jgi:hypothetical protein
MLVHVLSYTAMIFIMGMVSWRITGINQLAWAWPLTVAVIHFAVEWPMGRFADMYYHRHRPDVFLAISIVECTVNALAMILSFDRFFWM